MAFWVFMLVCDLLVPVIMVVFGWVFQNRPPKTINGLYGYRTARSMKNGDTWRFAHACCGRLWWRLGWLVLVLTAAVMLAVLGGDIQRVSIVGGIVCGVQCVVLVATIFPVERALRREFDEFGRRKG